MNILLMVQTMLLQRNKTQATLCNTISQRKKTEMQSTAFEAKL